METICKRCKKPKRKSRSGSLTDWIFRASSCTCTVSISEEDLSNIEIVEEKLPELGDRYQVVELISKGATGRVYSVFDTASTDVVAAKVLHDELREDRELVARFQQEVSILRSLDHPNLTAIHDHGFTSDGTPFLIMDLIDSRSLAQALDDGIVFDLDSILQMLCEICDALSYIHRNDVVHRDLKPANILLEELSGGGVRPRLVDFGIAKLNPTPSRSTCDLTQTGDVFGTPTYMSPEQCMGFSQDARSDIYSLGCIIYELLSGAPPFEGDNAMQLVIQHINSLPPPIRSRIDGPLVSPLQGIAYKCLIKDAADRYQCVDDLKADLDALRQGRKPKIHVPTSKTRASYSTGEAIKICSLLVFFFCYSLFILHPSGEAVAFVSMLVLSCPFWLLRIVSLYRKQDLGKTDREISELIANSNYLLLALSAIPVLIVLCGFFESAGAQFQSFLVFPFGAHSLLAISSACATVGVLLSGDVRTKGVRTSLVRFFGLSIPAALVMIFFLWPGALRDYGKVSEIGLPRLARAFYGASISLSPISYAYEDMGGLLANSDPEAAIENFGKALQLSGYDGKDVSFGHHRYLIRIRADVLDSIGRHDEAIRDVSKVMNRFSNVYGGDGWKQDSRLEWRARYYLHKGDLDSSIRDNTYYLAMSPGEKGIRALKGRAAAYFRKGNLDLALADLGTVGSIVEGDKIKSAEVAIERGILLDSSDKKEAAKVEYRRALDLLNGSDYSTQSLPFFSNFLKGKKSPIMERMLKPYLMHAFVSEKLGDRSQSAKDLALASEFGLSRDDLLETFTRDSDLGQIW